MSPAPVKPQIDLTVLKQVDVRIGTIELVSAIEGSDKLVALRVTFGDHTRTIVAALKLERNNPREIEGKRCSLSTCVRARCAALCRRACFSILDSPMVLHRYWRSRNCQCLTALAQVNRVVDRLRETSFSPPSRRSFCSRAEVKGRQDID